MQSPNRMTQEERDPYVAWLRNLAKHARRGRNIRLAEYYEIGADIASIEPPYNFGKPP